MSTRPERILDHEYDGIREYDNPLPGWWTWLFVLTFVFSVLYWMYYHIGVGATVEDKHEAAVARHSELMLAQLGITEANNEALLGLLSGEDNRALVESMATVFKGNCAQCHRDDGGGNIGPNLTDDYWKNVEAPIDVFSALTDGVAGTAMTAWGDRMSEPQRILLSAYVMSLRGSNPPSPKEGEGRVIPAWEEAVDADAEETADDDG